VKHNKKSMITIKKECTKYIKAVTLTWLETTSKEQSDKQKLSQPGRNAGGGNFCKETKKKQGQDRVAYVEDEALVLGLEREAVAEVDAPHQHHDRRRRGQRVRRVRERRRLHAQRGRWQCSLYLPVRHKQVSRARGGRVREACGVRAFSLPVCLPAVVGVNLPSC
jgi:hypothetical protein